MNKVLLKVLYAGLALCALALIPGIYYHNLFFGHSVKEWFTAHDEQSEMYDASLAYRKSKNLACADPWGGVTQLKKLIETYNVQGLTVVKNGKRYDVHDAEMCMEEIMKGPTSPRDDIPSMIKGITGVVTSAFAGEPEPQLIKTVTYNPRKYGPGGMKVDMTNYTRYDCEGSYQQTFGNGRSVYIGCNGIKNQNMPVSTIKMMPIEDSRLYGKALINTNVIHTSINLNIPQIRSEYSDIVGNLTLRFYR